MSLLDMLVIHQAIYVFIFHRSHNFKHCYKKTGVLLMGLQSKATVQATLFDDPIKQARSDSRMHIMDAINRKMGKGSMTIASSGIQHRWAMRRERKTPNYTTDWNELPVAG